MAEFGREPGAESWTGNEGIGTGNSTQYVEIRGISMATSTHRQAGTFVPVLVDSIGTSSHQTYLLEASRWSCRFKNQDKTHHHTRDYPRTTLPKRDVCVPPCAC